jgi:hypothetical protein
MLRVVNHQCTAVVKPSETFIPPPREGILACSQGVSMCCMTSPIPICLHCIGHSVLNELKVLNYLPQSPDLSPCDWQVLGHLKKVVKGQRFWLDTEVKVKVVQWFQQQLERSSLKKGYPGWCVNVMPASMPMETTFNGLYVLFCPEHASLETSLIITTWIRSSCCT